MTLEGNYRGFEVAMHDPGIAVITLNQPERLNGELIVRDKHGVAIGKMPGGGLYIDQTYWPLSGEDGLDYDGPLGPKMDQVIWGGILNPDR